MRDGGNATKQAKALRRYCGIGGGLLTRRSSPFFMWLSDRIAELGTLAVAVVDDDRGAKR